MQSQIAQQKNLLAIVYPLGSWPIVRAGPFHLNKGGDTMKRFLLLAFSCMIIMAALATFLPKVARASGAGNSLFGVAAVSDDDVWATGQFIPSAGPVQALIEHWNGHTWQVVSNPTPAGTQFSQLHGLAAISKDDIWAVGGFTTAGGNGQTLTEHWNGAHWKIVPSPTPVGATNSFLSGVVAVSHHDVWAVGETQESNGFSGTLIEHWNGHTWQIVSSPSPGPQVNALLGVAAVSHHDVWAVGYFFDTTSTRQTLIERWDGHTWQIVPSTAPANSALPGVAAVSHDDVWAVGDFVDSTNTTRVLIEHWNGHTWQTITGLNPAGSSSAFLEGVTAVSHKDIWAVGDAFGTNGACLTLIEHWNGHTWQIVSSPNPAGSTCNSLNGVAAVPHDEDVWAVGNAFGTNGSTLTLIEAWNGSSWRSVPSPTP
jgi:hypothetical protein